VRLYDVESKLKLVAPQQIVVALVAIDSSKLRVDIAEEGFFPFGYAQGQNDNIFPITRAFVAVLTIPRWSCLRCGSSAPRWPAEDEVVADGGDVFVHVFEVAAMVDLFDG